MYIYCRHSNYTPATYRQCSKWSVVIVINGLDCCTDKTNKCSFERCKFVWTYMITGH